MDTVTVVGNAPFPDIPEGRAVTVERTLRIDGLLESGRISLVEEPVPDTVAEVKTWVGADPARAARALSVEELRPAGPRTTLLSWLEDLTSTDSPPAAASDVEAFPTFDYTGQPAADNTGDLTGPD